MADGDARVRLFVAWFPDAPLLALLADPRLESLREIGRRVPDANRHVTALFIGDTPEGEIGAIRVAVDQAASTHHAFPLAPDRLAVRGSSRNPMLWAMYRPSWPLQSIRDSLVRSIGREPLSAQAATVTPHITLFRFPARGRRQAKEIAARHGDLAVPAQVDHLSLVASRLTREGSVYTRLHTRTLAPRGQD